MAKEETFHGEEGKNFYLGNKENKKILLSENYIQAKIYLANGNKEEAISLLKKVIFSNDATYSTLSFFLSIIDLNFSIFCKVCSINCCPAKPGLTLIIKTRSI